MRNRERQGEQQAKEGAERGQRNAARDGKRQRSGIARRAVAQERDADRAT